MQKTIVTLDFFSTLAQSIAKNLNAPLYLPHVETFADGEMRIDIDKTQLKNQSVIFVHAICPPINENFIKFTLCVQALKANGISDITAVIPYLGYSRQMLDSNNFPGGAHMIVSLLQATGITRIITCALHDPQLINLFTIPAHHLPLENAIIDHLKKNFHDTTKMCCIAPDHGAQQRVQHIATTLDCSTAFYSKTRIAADTPKILACDWHCTGNTAIIIDDIIDTATTMLAVCDNIQTRGTHETYAYAIHPVFSRNACERIAQSCLKKLFVCNTIEGIACAGEKIETIDVGPYIAEELKKL